MFKKLRSKLTPAQVKLFKLVLWACVAVWIILFTAASVALATNTGEILTSLRGSGFIIDSKVDIILPIALIFNALMVVTVIASWVGKKL